MRPIKIVVSILITIAFAHTISTGAPNSAIVYDEVTRLDAADQLARARCEAYSCFSTVEQMVSAWCPNPQICDAYVLQGRELVYFQWCLAQTLVAGQIPAGCTKTLFPLQAILVMANESAQPIKYPLCGDLRCTVVTCTDTTVPYCLCEVDGVPPERCVISYPPCYNLECHTLSCGPSGVCLCTREDASPVICSSGAPGA